MDEFASQLFRSDSAHSYRSALRDLALILAEWEDTSYWNDRLLRGLLAEMLERHVLGDEVQIPKNPGNADALATRLIEAAKDELYRRKKLVESKAWVVTIDRRRNGLDPFAPTQVAVCMDEENMRKAVMCAVVRAEGKGQLTVQRIGDGTTVWATTPIDEGELWVCTNGTSAWSTTWSASAEQFPLNEVVDWQ
jgi:hypothetical protein